MFLLKALNCSRGATANTQPCRVVSSFRKEESYKEENNLRRTAAIRVRFPARAYHGCKPSHSARNDNFTMSVRNIPCVIGTKIAKILLSL